MSTYKKVLFCSLYFVLTNTFSQQDQWNLVTDESQISYRANHPLHSWEGINKKIKAIAKVNPEQNTLEELAILTLVEDYNSNNSGRDAHALEVLEALSYPQVRFYAKDFISEQDSLQISGVLEFHGVTKSLSVKSKLKKDKSQLLLQGQFEIKPTEFSIDLPSFMMVKMEDRLLFQYSLTFERLK
jgi:polyisoprenoid-binding protein YceI